MGWLPFRRLGLRYRDSRPFGVYSLIAPVGGEAVYLLNRGGCVVHQWRVSCFQPGYGYLPASGNLLVRGQPLVETAVGIGQPAGRADILLEPDWDSNVIWQ